MKNDTAFETQNMLQGPGNGAIPCCQWGPKPLSLFLWLFKFFPMYFLVLLLCEQTSWIQ